MSGPQQTLSAQAAALAEGTVSASALLEGALQRIAAAPELNVFLAVDPEGARAAARAADERRQAGQARSILDGVPVALKDALVTEGLATTAGSRILQGWVPPYDGEVARRLRAAGVVIVGKTNMDEFAMGSSSEHSAYGPVKNPLDPRRVAGGSSGGSAAAVAAGMVAGALGTDTGGSVRQPAAMTGVAGLKPTYGRVSRHGVIAYASSLEQVGPLAHGTRDLALLLEIIAGFDPKDSTSAEVPVPSYAAGLEDSVQGIRIGVPAEYFVEGLDREVEAAVRRALAALEARGAVLVPLSLPHTRYVLPAYYVLATAEASANLARYDGVRYGRRAPEAELSRLYARSRFEGFGPEVRRRIILGTYVLSAGYYDAYYGQAQKVRTLVRDDFTRAFTQVDALACPTSPVTAFRLGERLEDPLSMYLADVFTLAANLAGVPALSLPCGRDGAGLPIGLQLMGRWFEEALLLRVGRALERAQLEMQTPG